MRGVGVQTLTTREQELTQYDEQGSPRKSRGETGAHPSRMRQHVARYHSSVRADAPLQEVAPRGARNLGRHFASRLVDEDYEIDRTDEGIIGVGAFADVRRGVCRQSGKQVVVKTFREASSVFADSLQRELRSLDAIRSLSERDQKESHKGRGVLCLDERNRAKFGCHDYLAVYGNIDAALADAGSTSGGMPNGDSYYMDKNTAGGTKPELHVVFDLLSGGDLFDFIMDDPVRSPNGRVLEPVAAHIGHQIVTSLMHSQRAGWCHLDLKPENVCIVRPSDATSSLPQSESAHGEVGNASGQNFFDAPEVSLIDFGHARPVPFGTSRYDEAKKDTLEDVLYPQDAIIGEAGSDSYAAPEVLWRSTFGVTSDVWSFGILLYAMLSGALPWPEGKQYDFLMDQGEIDACLDAHLTHGLLQPVVVDVLRKCLVIDPQKRWHPEQLLSHEIWQELSSERSHSETPWDALKSGSEPIPDYKQQAYAFQKQDVVRLRGSFVMGKARRGLKRWGKEPYVES